MVCNNVYLSKTYIKSLLKEFNNNLFKSQILKTDALKKVSKTIMVEASYMRLRKHK